MDNRGKKFYLSQLFPPWNTGLKDNRIQLNPRTAILQHEAKLKTQQLLQVTVVICIMFGLVAMKYVSRPTTNTQASFNFKRSAIGSITSINTINDSFTLTYISSQDQNIVDTKIKSWTVHLIPGKSITKSRASDVACFLMDDIQGNLSTATPTDCRNVVTVGRKIITDYVFLNIPMKSMVVNSIIGNK